MDCKNNHIDLDSRIDGMLRSLAGLTGIPVITVTGHTSIVPCSHNHLTFDQLIALTIGTDGCGKPAFRVKYINSCVLAKTCSKPKSIIDAFAYDASAKTFALVLNLTA